MLRRKQDRGKNMRQTSVREIVHSVWLLNLKYTFRKTLGVVGPVLSYLQCSRILKAWILPSGVFLTSDITPRCTSKEVFVFKKVD